ncbi:MAG: hypothetical protein E7208_00920 [Clostridium butyricum]|nr:hypothetical protein [Clostridium butyricum]
MRYKLDNLEWRDIEMNDISYLESEIKELKLTKRNLLLAGKDTKDIDKKIELLEKEAREN